MNVLQWLQKYTPREQLYLLAAALMIVLYVAVAIVWQPLDRKRDELARNNVQVAAQLAQVKALASELQSLKSGGAASRDLNLNELINSSTNELGVRPSRVQPNSRGESQIRFEDVNFAQLLRWLHRMEMTPGVVVQEVAINQGDRGGLVQATIRIGQGAGG